MTKETRNHNGHILTVKKLSKSFGKIKVLHDLKLSVGLGEIYSIIGPNGAGKTTLFNLITGLIPKDSGTVLFYNKKNAGKSTGSPVSDITHKKPYEIARLGMGRTFQGNRVFSNMSVLENVMFARQLIKIENPLSILNSAHKNLLNKFKENPGHYTGSREKEVYNLEEYLQDEAFYWLDYVGLGGLEQNKAEELSYGQQKLLSIARLLMADSRLLLFDEPTAGVNPRFAERIAEIFKKIVINKDRTILFIEHDMKFIQALGCKCLYLEEGRCPWPFFELEVIMENPDIRRKFMGVR